MVGEAFQEWRSAGASAAAKAAAAIAAAIARGGIFDNPKLEFTIVICFGNNNSIAALLIIEREGLPGPDVQIHN